PILPHRVAETAGKCPSGTTGTGGTYFRIIRAWLRLMVAAPMPLTLASSSTDLNGPCVWRQATMALARLIPTPCNASASSAALAWLILTVGCACTAGSDAAAQAADPVTEPNTSAAPRR